MAVNRTFELWKNFMPRRKEIKNTVGDDLFSVQIYDSKFNFTHFEINANFEKWAAVEVADFSNVPDGMQTLVLPPGLYAVFLHVGPASEGEKTFRYIFETWIPNSNYQLDNRPHFEILCSKYKHNDPDSEEEIWIPVKLK
jgi:AraC family transcriptional regulator